MTLFVTTADGRRHSSDGRRATGEGRRTTGDGRRTTDDGRWPAALPRRTTDDGCGPPSPPPQPPPRPAPTGATAEAPTPPRRRGQRASFQAFAGRCWWPQNRAHIPGAKTDTPREDVRSRLLWACVFLVRIPGPKEGPYLFNLKYWFWGLFSEIPVGQAPCSLLLHAATSCSWSSCGWRLGLECAAIAVVARVRVVGDGLLVAEGGQRWRQPS